MDLIETQADVAAGAAALARLDPRFAAALECTGPLPLRRKPAGFEALLDAVVSQQVSVASAAAIWQRVRGLGLHEPSRIRAASDDDLRAAGLSRPKMRYFRALAAADIPFDALADLDDAEVLTILTNVTGIGLWTAEVYALQCLGRADIFPAGDLALQEAAKLVFQLDMRPAEKPMRAMAAGWAPHRAVAARLLWAYYGQIKTREGIR